MTDGRTDERTEGRTEGWTDPILQDPFSQGRGSNKLKSAVEDQTGVTLRMNIKIFHGKSLPHELLLTTRQTTKLRNAFENMSTDIKLSKTQPRLIQSGGYLGPLSSKIAGPLMKVAVPLAKKF